MNNGEIRVLTLRRLLDDNFAGSRLLRGLAESLNDASLKNYFQNLASRRSQFAIELGEEIHFYTGKKVPASSTHWIKKWEEPGRTGKNKCLKNALRAKKLSLQKYQEALCRIHDGSCREVLLRHKAYLENCIFELKALKSLLKYSAKTEDQLDEIHSTS
ncbi:hypothetical protein JRG66_11480 [Salinimicrobium tongyeongense]|uniref:DUF2383 domain-containing protein n=1 Tax=Salinimicrobium tongyeongense TaxID=2809707 RepID=A0ABY6NPT9_9FLAO|nr:hypothetical protein [Salinimicrobium tongyeongense]UZH54588.1 hypothetical protein JRG66_11480 [Salinimicrobium tongyeongense]